MSWEKLFGDLPVKYQTLTDPKTGEKCAFVCIHEFNRFTDSAKELIREILKEQQRVNNQVLGDKCDELDIVSKNVKSECAKELEKIKIGEFCGMPVTETDDCPEGGMYITNNPGLLANDVNRNIDNLIKKLRGEKCI